MRITIKCEGLSVRTKDLEMGMGILDQIAKHGIMNHSFISNKLLEKASDIIQSAHHKLAMFGIIKKVKDSFKMPNFAPADVDLSKSPVPMKDGVPAEAITEQPRKKYSSPKKVNAWTIEEDKLVCDMLGSSVKKAKNNPILKERHTTWAIGTRFSLYKNSKFERLNTDRANVMKAYLSGQRIETPVANIYGHDGRPALSGKKDSSVDTSDKTRAWTQEEIQIMKDNIMLKPRKMKKLIPNRTYAAMLAKRKKLIRTQIKSAKNESIENVPVKTEPVTVALPKIKAGKGSWSEDQLNAIRLNMHMSPKELLALPWLKEKTWKQISNKKAYIKTYEK